MENAKPVPTANAKVVQIERRQAAVVRRTLRMFKNVSYAANGVDERFRCILVNFVSQAINVDVDDICCGINPHSPNVIKYHRTSNDTPGVPTKIFQKRKFLCRQLQQLIAAASLMTDKV